MTTIHPDKAQEAQQVASAPIRKDLADPLPTTRGSDTPLVSTPSSASAAVVTESHRPNNAGAISMAILRISLGFTFLWAFLDKLFGLGYSTTDARSWLNGGSPTRGFLANVEAGPLRGFFRSIAGAGWADWLFMLGLAGIGVALTLGAGIRIASITGIVMMALMWFAEFPPAQHLADGTPSGSTNPLVDYHWIYAAGLLVVAMFGVASRYGLGRWWVSRDAVRRNAWLK